MVHPVRGGLGCPTDFKFYGYAIFRLSNNIFTNN